MRAAASVIVAVLAGAVWLAVSAAAAENERRLQQRLKQFPEADANGDGVLTEAEARQHQRARKEKKAAAAATEEKPAQSVPTQANIAYGPHARNVLDLWRAKSDRPTPVLIFFHGGSFKAGDKASVLTRPIFAQCLEAGISVVSANYRFSTDAPFPAQMHDGARVVQYVRSRAKEWNVEPARIALSGGSAGATLALWVALHEDFADPASRDPVARFSTRVTCASPHSGTAGLEPAYFKEHAGVTRLGAAIYQLFGASSADEMETADKRALARQASAVRHATRDDPPLFLTYAGDPAEAPFKPDAPQNAWIHHVSLGAPLKKKYDELGVECALYHGSKPAPAGAEITFLKRHLFK